MKVSVIGVGVQGSSITYVLTRIKEVSEIICADANSIRTKRLAEKLSDDKVHTCIVDASNLSELTGVIKGTDVVINATLPQYNLTVMDAALKSGVHYVDLASNDPVEQLELTKRWKEAGLAAVITQGGPFVVNAAVKSAADDLDRVDEIRLRHGWKKLGENELVQTWSHSWSPEVALSEWEGKPVVYRNGEHERMPTFSGMEEYGFPDPLGPLTVCSVDYEPVYTLPRFVDKGVRYVDCKIPPDLMAGALIKMGLASRSPIEVKGVRIAPRDVLMALTPQPADENDRPEGNSDVLLCYLGEVEGEKAGERLVHIVYRSSSALENLRRYGVRWADVAVPTVVTALILAKGDVEPGIVPPEGLPPFFLTELAGWGMSFQHIITKVA